MLEQITKFPRASLFTKRSNKYKGEKRKVDDAIIPNMDNSKKAKKPNRLPILRVKKAYKAFLESPKNVIQSVQFRQVKKRDGLRLVPYRDRLSWNTCFLISSTLCLKYYNNLSKNEQLLLNDDDCYASFTLVYVIEDEIADHDPTEAGITAPGEYGRRAMVLQVLSGQSRSKILVDADAYMEDEDRPLRNESEQIYEYTKNLSEMPAAWREMFFEASTKSKFVAEGPWLRSFQVAFSIKVSSFKTYSYTYKQLMRFLSIPKWSSLCELIRTGEITELDSLAFASCRLCEGYGIRTVFNGISALNTLASQMGCPWKEEFPRLKQAFRKAFHEELQGGDGLDKKQIKMFIIFMRNKRSLSRISKMVYLLFKGCFIFLLRCSEGLFLPWYLLKRGKFPDAEGVERYGVKALIQNAKTRSFDEPPQEVLVFENREFWNPNTYYEELLSTRCDKIFIFVNEKGELYNPQAIYKEFGKMVKAFKKSLPKNSHTRDLNIVIHSARISMIALLFNHGFHILVIRELARHAWVQTTVSYLRKSSFIFGNTYCLKQKLKEINFEIDRGKFKKHRRHLEYHNTSIDLHTRPVKDQNNLISILEELDNILKGNVGSNSPVLTTVQQVRKRDPAGFISVLEELVLTLSGVKTDDNSKSTSDSTVLNQDMDFGILPNLEPIPTSRTRPKSNLFDYFKSVRAEKESVILTLPVEGEMIRKIPMITKEQNETDVSIIQAPGSSSEDIPLGAQSSITEGGESEFMLCIPSSLPPQNVPRIFRSPEIRGRKRRRRSTRVSRPPKRFDHESFD